VSFHFRSQLFSNIYCYYCFINALGYPSNERGMSPCCSKRVVNIALHILLLKISLLWIVICSPNNCLNAQSNNFIFFVCSISWSIKNTMSCAYCRIVKSHHSLDVAQSLLSDLSLVLFRMIANISTTMLNKTSEKWIFLSKALLSLKVGSQLIFNFGSNVTTWKKKTWST
jgi:hypothetical protein